MSHTTIVSAALLFLSVGCIAPVANGAESPTRKPNVVLILMDDLGYGDLASYGATDTRTPNLDRLAREGVRLTDAYANGPVCSPTRAALISGRYQQRTGIEWVLTIDLPEDRERGLPVTGTSLPALLDAQGYATGLIGKWHLGFKAELGPNAQGFAEFFGFRAGVVDFYSHTRGDGTPDLYENTTPARSDRYLTDEFSERAVRFIDRHANGPFFLEVAYNAPHWPFEPPDLAPDDPRRQLPHPELEGDRRLAQMPDDKAPAARADYVRMVERADAGIGAILQALDRHHIADNTLVIFTSDNGGEWLSRNAPFFHRKNSLWEGGIRVPLLLRWPARLPAGKVSEQPAITMDLSASILAASGAKFPEGYRLDGIDLVPGLAAGTQIERQLYWRLQRPDRDQKAVRSVDWKLLVDSGQYFLFNLKTDAGERSDLSAQRPELVSKLKGLLANWEQDVDRSAAAIKN